MKWYPHTPHATRKADCSSPALRNSGALLLLVLASLLTACGGGAIVCANGPGPAALLVWEPVSDPNARHRVYCGSTASGTYDQLAGAGLDAATAITLYRDGTEQRNDILLRADSL
jgi:hypothetical protein